MIKGEAGTFTIVLSLDSCYELLRIIFLFLSFCLGKIYSGTGTPGIAGVRSVSRNTGGHELGIRVGRGWLLAGGTAWRPW